MSENSVYNSPNARNSDDAIHVALCVYDPKGTYSQHAGVVMTSIFENTKSKVTVHILHDQTLTEDNRKKFIRTAEKYSQGLEFHDVTDYIKILDTPDLQAILRLNDSSLAAMYRLLIPELFAYTDKIIYLDCDVLVDADISELWSVDIHDKSLAGAVDLPGINFNDSIYREKMRILLNGCRPETYINAGVLLMNLRRIRGCGNLFRRSVDWLLQRGKMALAADQDALNSLFAGDIKIIDSRFNQNVLIPDMSGRIIHMLFGKAWREIKGLQSDRLYWKMYLRSAWGENVSCDELVDILNDAATRSASPKQFILKRILLQVKLAILKIIPLRALRYVLRDMYYRLKYHLTRR